MNKITINLCFTYIKYLKEINSILNENKREQVVINSGGIINPPCRPSKIPVEAELGKVGGKEDDLDGGDDNSYTDPQEAKEFTERTGADSLSVCILGGCKCIQSDVVFCFSGRISNNQLRFIFQPHNVMMLRQTIFLSIFFINNIHSFLPFKCSRMFNGRK